MTTMTTTSITAPVTLTKEGRLLVEDGVGEVTDIGKAAKMFMWYVQTYHPHIEHEFQAVEDTKENI
jgi:hypothetical protein